MPHLTGAIAMFSNLVWVAVLALPLIVIGIGAYMAGADRRPHREGRGRG
ncbi:hypothetical protein FHR71_001199 [Methylobacterium sp. RAS18]|nr:hypothetical protein [Methylobacterium sp. RAS18]